MPTSAAVDQRSDREVWNGTTPRVGHAAGVLLAVGGLWVANNLLRWDILPFLTDDFDRVLPLINLSLVVNLVVSAIRLVHPRVWLVAATELVTLVAGLPALVRMWRVFPFDIRGRRIPWELGLRVLLVVAMVGTVLGFLAGVVRLARLAVTARADEEFGWPTRQL